MPSYSKIVLVGNLTHDPEIKTVKDHEMVECGIGVRDTYRKETDFFDVVAWGPQAQYLARYAVKGTLVLIDGTPKMEQWHDKNDNFRSSFKVVVRDCTVLARGRDHQEDTPQQPRKQPRKQQQQQPQQQPQQAPQPLPNETDEDIPF